MSMQKSKEAIEAAVRSMGPVNDNLDKAHAGYTDFTGELDAIIAHTQEVLPPLIKEMDESYEEGVNALRRAWSIFETKVAASRDALGLQEVDGQAAAAVSNISLRMSLGSAANEAVRSLVKEPFKQLAASSDIFTEELTACKRDFDTSLLSEESNLSGAKRAGFILLAAMVAYADSLGTQSE